MILFVLADGPRDMEERCYSLTCLGRVLYIYRVDNNSYPFRSSLANIIGSSPAPRFTILQFNFC